MSQPDNDQSGGWAAEDRTTTSSLDLEGGRKPILNFAETAGGVQVPNWERGTVGREPDGVDCWPCMDRTEPRGGRTRGGPDDAQQIRDPSLQVAETAGLNGRTAGSAGRTRGRPAMDHEPSHTAEATSSSRVVSRRPRSPHLCRRFVMYIENIMGLYGISCFIITYYYLEQRFP